MQNFYTVKDVAALLKISTSSVYRYSEQGLFPCCKIGSNVRFTDEHIASFLAANPIATQKTATMPRTIEDMRSFYGAWQ